MTVPNGGDSNPWYLGNETIIEGCQGCQASASSRDDAQNPWRSPASDWPPMNQYSVTKPGVSRCSSTRQYKNDSQASKDNRNSFPRLEYEELDRNAEYLLHSGNASRTTPAARGCQPGNFPTQLSPENDTPRSMSPRLDQQLLDLYYSSISSVPCEIGIQSRDLAPKDEKNTESAPQTQQRNGVDKIETEPAPNKECAKDIKQNAQDIQHCPVAVYRQFDIDQDEDGDETDQELSEDPKSND